jgi:hypothetical protein
LAKGIPPEKEADAGKTVEIIRISNIAKYR